MQIEEGVMAIVYDTLQDLYNSSNHMKDKHSKHSKEFFLLHVYSFL